MEAFPRYACLSHQVDKSNATIFLTFLHCGPQSVDSLESSNERMYIIRDICHFVDTSTILTRVVGDHLVLGVTKDRGAHPIGQLTWIYQSEKERKLFYDNILDFMMIF